MPKAARLNHRMFSQKGSFSGQPIRQCYTSLERSSKYCCQNTTSFPVYLPLTATTVIGLLTPQICLIIEIFQMAAKTAFSTPVNVLSRKDLVILVRNNTLDEPVELAADYDRMETDSPLSGNRQPLRTLDPISKKLFHSPQFQNSRVSSKNLVLHQNNNGQRRPKKRKQSLLPGSEDTIKMAYMKECESDGYSPSQCEGMRKKVLISLFHNREYTMDFSE